MLLLMNIVSPPAISDNLLLSPYPNHNDIIFKVVLHKWPLNEIIAFPLSETPGCILVCKNAECCTKLLPMVLKVNSPYPLELLTITWFMSTSCTESNIRAALIRTWCSFVKVKYSSAEIWSVGCASEFQLSEKKCRLLFGVQLIFSSKFWKTISTYWSKRFPPQTSLT